MVAVNRAVAIYHHLDTCGGRSHRHNHHLLRHTPPVISQKWRSGAPLTADLFATSGRVHRHVDHHNGRQRPSNQQTKPLNHRSTSTVPSTHLAIVMKTEWEEVESAVTQGAHLRITGYPLYDNQMKRLTTLVHSIHTISSKRKR